MAQDFDWTISRRIQYNNSKTLNAILQGLNDMLSISASAFIDGVLNIDKAKGTQLDVIGALLGASRTITFPDYFSDEDMDFGFDASEWGGFDQYGGTFDVKPMRTTTIQLEDNAYRTYIKFKAYANISNCSLYSINYMLGRIFEGRGLCYANQTGVTEITMTFNFDLAAFEKNLIINRYIPIPAGYSLVLVEN